ncbi:F-box protein At1g78280-like [Stylophora pistillata]|uniref:F-box protein At1g78280-like n=1 Tax=Stylophora pistillata TaxID=50429 RepID=UPI000C039F46|nr:F-box protein At1g78280-like [Stylophora pistillata]
MDAINFPKFSKDFFEEVVDEDIRPPQLSFEMAPTRSGFHWRVEALNASLWSALIQGKKLWGLYPPSKYYVPGVNHNNHRTQTSQQSESFTWWIYTRPELQDDHKPQECVQEAGEILYIPSGWWWSNVNVDDTITIQKSICDQTNIRSCMEELKELADSVAENFHADVYIQLRNYLAIYDPGFLTDDDRQFKSPIRGLGQTNSDHGENFHQNVWKKFFEEGVDDAKFSSNRDDEANVHE